MESQGDLKESRIELPAYIEGYVDVFVNGVLQERGVDYDQLGQTLVFRRELAREGKLGFWRWLSLFLGVAGTYRKNDTVDVVFTRDGRRTVESFQAASPTSSE
jgi:uncharacterized protein (DUF2342 family)